MAIIAALDAVKAAALGMAVPKMPEMLPSILAPSNGQVATTALIKAPVAPLSGLSLCSVGLSPFSGSKIHCPLDL
jgi:hypothetical protein